MGSLPEKDAFTLNKEEHPKEQCQQTDQDQKDDPRRAVFDQMKFHKTSVFVGFPKPRTLPAPCQWPLIAAGRPSFDPGKGSSGRPWNNLSFKWLHYLQKVDNFIPQLNV
jgi:hypothetical protein